MTNTPWVDDAPWLTGMAQRWYATRTYGAGSFSHAREVAARKRACGLRVSVGIPALNEEETIAPICYTIRRRLMDEAPLVDQLVVLDSGSSDRTADAARAAGAVVAAAADLLPEIPIVPGKGEVLWRSLTVLDGDIVVWVDGDIRNFRPHFVTRLVEPLLNDPGLAFTKAYYRRPIALDGVMLPSGGGRVTELLARPLLNALFPELACFIQPLSGEYAARRDVLVQLPFFSGYSVEVGLLIDLLPLVGLDRLAQVDLEERVHRNRRLTELSPMAYVIARTILRRAEEWGRLKAALDYPSNPLLVPASSDRIEIADTMELERPPMSLMPTVLDGLRSSGNATAAMS